MTIGDWLPLASVVLEAAGVAEPRLDAQMLAAHALQRDRSWVLAHPEAELPDLIGNLLDRRSRREPLAYILGWREFFGRRFVVTPEVLIPRQETELLVEAVLRDPVGPVLDLCCGSGCIGITVALETGLPVTLSDVSPGALTVAADNAAGLGADVEVVESDGWTNLESRRFAWVLCNPPYVPDSADLEPEVSAYEPRIALFAGQSGDQAFRWIAAGLADHLVPGGKLAMELGSGQAEMVANMFAEIGRIKLLPDLQGINRVILLAT